MDSGRIRALGWRPEISLAHGIELAYGHFLQEHPQQAVPVA